MKIQIIEAGQGPKLSVLGDDQFIKVSAAETCGGCSIIEQISQPGSHVPLHVHTREDEVFHVLEGEVRLDLGGTTQHVSADTTIFLPRRVPHGFAVEGNRPARLLIIATPGGIEEMFSELDRLPPGPRDLRAVSAICERYGIRFVPTPQPASVIP